MVELYLKRSALIQRKVCLRRLGTPTDALDDRADPRVVQGILTARTDTTGRGGCHPRRSRVCAMVEALIAVIQSIGESFVRVVPISLALGATFALLTFFWACNP